MSFYARTSVDQKRIYVKPGEQFKAGVTQHAGKPSHGWLRVGLGSKTRFYKLPVAAGELHASVGGILDIITKQCSAGQDSCFFWERRERAGFSGRTNRKRSLSIKKTKKYGLSTANIELD